MIEVSELVPDIEKRLLAAQEAQDPAQPPHGAEKGQDEATSLLKNGFPLRHVNQISIGLHGPGHEMMKKHLKRIVSGDALILLTGNRGCLSGDAMIYDAIRDIEVRVEDAYTGNQSLPVLSLTPKGVQICQASTPFVKGFAPLWKVIAEDGTEITVAQQHKFLTLKGWLPLSSIAIGDLIAFSVFRPSTISEFSLSGFSSNGVNSSQKAEDYQGGCSTYFRQCDERPRNQTASCLAFSPSRPDALECIHYLHTHLLIEEECNQIYPRSFLRSKHHFDPSALTCSDISSLSLLRENALQFHALSSLHESTRRSTQVGSLFQKSSSHEGSFHEFDQHLDSVFFSCQNDIGWQRIRSIQFAGNALFYDIHVPDSGNYLANGFWNHNSGKTQIAVTWAAERFRAGKSPGRYIKCADLIGEIKETWGKSTGERAVLDKYRRTAYLVIDEFHEKGASEWEARTLVNLLDHRYDDCKCTVLIANIEPSKITEAINPSIMDRANQTGGVINCDWESYR